MYIAVILRKESSLNGTRFPFE